MSNKYTTYTFLTAKIILLTLLITLFLSFLYTQYIKEEAIVQLSSNEAKKLSQFTFESIYNVMANASEREEILKSIERLNQIDSEMSIQVIRSEKLSKLYGEIESIKKIRDSDKLVQKALNGEELIKKVDDEYIRYLYPVKVQKKCLSCHINMEIGEVNGVIDIIYPITDVKLSLEKIMNLFIIFVTLFSIVIFFILFLNLKKYLILPIQNFIEILKSVYVDNNLSNKIEISSNIDEIKNLEDFFNRMLGILQRQFYTDSLTSLPNRFKLLEDIQSSKYPWLALMNIDSFQELNDFYGHEAGDAILKDLGDRLYMLLPSKDAKLYKLHSDEYAILIDKGLERIEFEEIVYNLIHRLQKEQFEFKSNSVSLNITAGVANSKEQLLTNCDIALKLAKKEGKMYIVYDSTISAHKDYENNILWIKRLKYALSHDNLFPYFQPIVNNKTQKIEKYECLARLKSEGQIISPYFFLDVAKKSKLYTKITRVILRKSFDYFRDLEYEFSINLSAQDILDVEVNEYIKELVKSYSGNERVVFELTESEGIENFDEVLEFIEFVKSYGCKVAIDDFGTGYSNFEYLMKLKVDYIKIDASMIKNIVDDKNAQVVTKTIVDFATQLGIKTIGEFVCSEEVYHYIKSIGVDYSQGFYFGKPQDSIQ